MVDIIAEKETTVSLSGLDTTTPVIVWDSSAEWSDIENSLLIKRMKIMGTYLIEIGAPLDAGIMLALAHGGHSASEIEASLSTTGQPLAAQKSDRAEYQMLRKRVVALHHLAAHGGWRSADDIDGTAGTTHVAVPFEFEFDIPPKGYVFDSTEMFDIWAISLAQGAHGAPVLNFSFRIKGVILND